MYKLKDLWNAPGEGSRSLEKKKVHNVRTDAIEPLIIEAAAAAWWLLCSAADPKDVGSILATAVVFRCRRNARDMCAV